MPEFDKQLTKIRRDIKDLYLELGINPTTGDFKCEYFDTCRKSLRIRKNKMIAGSWPYIGVNYGKALIKGKRLRIVVVGKDAGGRNDANIKFLQRQLEWRCAFEEPIPEQHPTCTALWLEKLVDDKRKNRFARQFAFTNAVKCSSANNKMTSVITSEICKQCESHLSKELDLLKPDIVLVQGISYPGDMIKRIYKKDEKLFSSEKVTIYKSGKVIVLITRHPTRNTPKWKQGILSRYINNAIEKVRQNV